MPGYQLANSDKSKIDKKYFCSFCELLLRDAMQTSCGHFYCFSCLGNLRDPVLPLVLVCLEDKQQLKENEVFADNFMRREVASIIVCCISISEGCTWKGEVRHLEAHTVGCDFQKVKCVHPECGILVKKTSLPHHLKNECEFRVVTCELCHSQVVFCKLKLHKENECPAYPIICDKCEKARIPRGKMADHQNPILGDCEKIEGPCPFSQIGCSKKEVLSQKEKKKHLSEENIHHNVLLLQFAVRVSKEMESVLRSDPRLLTSRQQMFMNYDNVIQDLFNQMQIRSETERHFQEMLRQHSERITAVERKLVLVNTSGGSSGASSQRLPDGDGSSVSADIERRVTDLGNKTADHEVLIVENNRIAMESSRETANLRRQLDNVQENSRRSEQRMESIEHALALRNVTLADLEEYVKKQEFLSYDGQLTWKITEYARKRSEAVNGQKVSFYSPSFYTSRYGYKMCARIYLNGDGMGRGTHISLFFVVMRGEYDAILRWPFRQKVTFMLLDQDNVEHVIDAFRPDPNSSSFQRPRRETNIASGCPTFCSIEELNNHAYVRDDTMFFKIIVDTSDL
ncbi:TNF receptor-associated factor 2-like isoform X2 [Acropora muricata]|uniref:TNF receptor-associated factor 2-like isoform X2 n=1 Tax=Acropora muricata TaxID=159855 RepID=UPI0034E4E8CA